MNIAAFAAAMVALNNARKEIMTANSSYTNTNTPYTKGIDEKLKNVQVSLCEELIKELNTTTDKTQLCESEKTLVKSGAVKSGIGYGAYWQVPNKVAAIKAVRERTGNGLGEAKAMVEDYMRTQGML